MNTWQPTDHPRGDRGRFKAKTHTEPEGGLGTEPVSTPKTFRDGWVEWRTPDGRRHRVDGPAVIRPGGTFEWWQNGQRHRTDGPTITSLDGFENWCQHDKLHRTDGPAVTYSDGHLEWWEDGVRKPHEVEAMLTMMRRARTPSRE